MPKFQVTVRKEVALVVTVNAKTKADAKFKGVQDSAQYDNSYWQDIDQTIAVEDKEIVMV